MSLPCIVSSCTNYTDNPLILDLDNNRKYPEVHSDDAQLKYQAPSSSSQYECNKKIPYGVR